MAKMKGAVVINTERCKGCNLCAVACPLKLIELSPHVNLRGYQYVVQPDPEPCNGCASCAIVCPDACITVYRKKTEQ